MKHARFITVLILISVFALAYIHVSDAPSINQLSAAEVGPVGPVAPVQDMPILTLRDLNRAFIEIAATVKPTVVTVFTEKTYRVRQNPFLFNPFADFFGGPSNPNRQAPEQEYRQQGLGSGIIVSADGNILTNYHVIAEADSIYVRTPDDRRFSAKVVGSDSKTDIAVIKIDADNLPAIRIGDSDKLQVGELVMAIGSPMSENLAQTVTQGIVSAKGRSNVGLADYEDFIQTDAAINPGNSGGPLVNLDGELVGVNSAIVSRSGGFQGIGFAVPSNMAMRIMNSLLTSGKVVRGWLGVSIQDINESLASAMKLQDKRGALVGDVLTDSRADQAGIQPGDIIVEMDGRKLENSAALRNNVASTRPDTKAQFKILREGKPIDLTVRLGELPSELGASGDTDDLINLLGFEFSNLDSDLARQYNLHHKGGGVVVTGIDNRSSAYQAGLREGDLIRAVDKQRVSDASGFRQITQGLQKGGSILMQIMREDRGFYIAFTL